MLLDRNSNDQIDCSYFVARINGYAVQNCRVLFRILTSFINHYFMSIYAELNVDATISADAFRFPNCVQNLRIQDFKSAHRECAY